MEIGTGTGYNTALLCERLGSKYVTSVDIDPELVELAHERLGANGYTPTLAAVDGAGGYPPDAPYDRIIATCAVLAIPPAWLEQAAPGAGILADVHGPIGGTLDFTPPVLIWQPEGEPVESVTEVDPVLLSSDGLFGFIAQWHLPDATWGQLTDEGMPGIHLWAPDGSRASIPSTPIDGGFLVSQVGPRRLWDQVEQAHDFWQQTGRPNYDRFGITATATEQYVWYDHPDSEHRWSLPTRPAPQPAG